MYGVYYCIVLYIYIPAMNRGTILHRAVKLKPVLQAAVALVLVFSLLSLFANYSTSFMVSYQVARYTRD
jgi:hypothetical protein